MSDLCKLIRLLDQNKADYSVKTYDNFTTVDFVCSKTGKFSLVDFYRGGKLIGIYRGL